MNPDHHALCTEKLCMHFGGLKAVSDLNLTINQGAIFGIIGPNGAGKTTVFNMLTGVYRPTTGKITAFGKNLVGNQPYQISVIGVSRTFQNIRLFKDLSVLDNIIIAFDNNPALKQPGPIECLFRTAAFHKSEEEKCARAAEYIELLSLSGREYYPARNLPYGDQRRLEIARALATGARIILLDEPAAGMTAQEREDLSNTIRFIRDKLSVTIVLIEHDMELVMEICERIAVLDYGQKIAEGIPAQIKCDERVIEAYLGKKEGEELLMNAPAPLITLDSVVVNYGAIAAVKEASFAIQQGEIVTLIGANGAGKTSILRCISGLEPCASGRIIYKGEEIQNLKPHHIVSRGLVQAPEGRGIFLNLSVSENLDLGAWIAKDRSRSKRILEEVFTLFPRLKERAHQNAGTLSGGEQQMLAIGRALMAEPELLLLDEPSLGLAPQLIETIFEIVVRINKEGKTVLLVEQNANQALQIAHRGVVLETGRVVLEGAASELARSEAVKKAYLGD